MSDDEDLSLGGWSIEQVVIDEIDRLLEPGDTILEFGSGYGTQVLSERYEMVSIEQKEEWVGRFDSTYIYAPLEDNWFAREPIKEELEHDYDLILVDGPIALARTNFPEHAHLFDLTVPLIFDDMERERDMKMAEEIADMTDRELQIRDGESKRFAVL